MPAVDERLRRLWLAARRPAPAVGFERPPRRLLTALRAAADEAAASAAALALLDGGRRNCATLLAELAEHERRAELAARQVRSARPRGSDLDSYVALASALDDVTQAVHDAGAWWCRSAGCDPAADGLAGTVRDATRELARVLVAFPEDGDDAIVAVRRRVAEGRRLARRPGRRGGVRGTA